MPDACRSHAHRAHKPVERQIGLPGPPSSRSRARRSWPRPRIGSERKICIRSVLKTSMAVTSASSGSVRYFFIPNASEFLLEPRKASAAVHQLLLPACPCGMRLRIDVEAQRIALFAPGCSGSEFGAIRHDHLYGVIVRMSIWLHRVRSFRPPAQRNAENRGLYSAGSALEQAAKRPPCLRAQRSYAGYRRGDCPFNAPGHCRANIALRARDRVQ